MPSPLLDVTDIRRFSNALRLMTEKRITALTERLVAGDITLAEWQQRMKDELRHANHLQFVTGRGGVKEAIYYTEYLKLGTELSRQYRYLQKFAEEIARRAEAGMSLDFAIARAKLYAHSTQAIMWRAAVPVDLPQVPRDGKTACRTNCKCRLDFKYERGEHGEVTAVLVWWKLRPAEHCVDCLHLSREWSPLRVETARLEEHQLASTEQGVALVLSSINATVEEAVVVREMLGVEAVMEGDTCKVRSNK